MSTIDTRETINFLDGSKIEIVADGGEEAETAYFAHVKPMIGAIQTEIANQRRICCDALRGVLDDQSRYPVLTYISPTKWQRGHMNGRYHGADGPGFYSIYQLEGADQSTYVRLKTCPYCQAEFVVVAEAGEVYEDDLSPNDL